MIILIKIPEFRFIDDVGLIILIKNPLAISIYRQGWSNGYIKKKSSLLFHIIDQIGLYYLNSTPYVLFTV